QLIRRSGRLFHATEVDHRIDMFTRHRLQINSRKLADIGATEYFAPNYLFTVFGSITACIAEVERSLHAYEALSTVGQLGSSNKRNKYNSDYNESFHDVN